VIRAGSVIRAELVDRSVCQPRRGQVVHPGLLGR